MSDPKRLLHHSESERERTLLRAGRAQAPQSAKERAFSAAAGVLAASHLGAAVTGGAAVKGGAALAGKAAAWAQLKWLGVLGAFGVASGGAVLYFAEANDEHPQTAVSTGSNPSGAASEPNIIPGVTLAPSSLTAPRVVESASPPSLAVPLRAPRTTTPVSNPAVTGIVPARSANDAASPATLNEELAALDRARRALESAQAMRCLVLLDEYTSRFPQGTMAPEATMLRIEALVTTGDNVAAARLADAFLAGDPQNPYAPRVRSLLGKKP